VAGGETVISAIEGLLSRVGWQRVSGTAFLSLVTAGVSILILITFQMTGSLMISFSLVTCLGVQFFDSLKARAAALAQKQNSDWPKFLDAIHSATWAGSSLEQAILDSKSFAPLSVNWAMLDLEKDLLAGVDFDLAMCNLKARLASPIVDRFVELTRLANQSGGRGYLAALRAQAVQLRLENATWTEVQVKQNWVIASAKLAVLAPWLILLLLCIRRETAATFNTETGMVVLLVGLGASLLAFQLVKVLSALPRPERVLAK
jgi:tight adherence protein B